MVKGWNSDHSRKVMAHIEKIVTSDDSQKSYKKNVAILTNCLPLYRGISGVIVISTNGDLFIYDEDYNTLTLLNERGWEKVAMMSLGTEYADLAELLPQRPKNSISCSACSGVGRVTYYQILCGVCSGTGWTETEN